MYKCFRIIDHIFSIYFQPNVGGKPPQSGNVPGPQPPHVPGMRPNIPSQPPHQQMPAKQNRITSIPKPAGLDPLIILQERENRCSISEY